MYSFMRTKDGKQACPRCDGKGCFSCAGRGHIMRCPDCGSTDGGFSAQGEEIRCSQCGTVFNVKGVVQRRNAEKEDGFDEDGPSR